MILNLKKKLFRVQLFTQITKATEDLSSSIVLFAWSSSYLFQCTREVTLVDFHVHLLTSGCSTFITCLISLGAKN